MNTVCVSAQMLVVGIKLENRTTPKLMVTLIIIKLSNYSDIDDRKTCIWRIHAPFNSKDRIGNIYDHIVLSLGALLEEANGIKQLNYNASAMHTIFLFPTLFLSSSFSLHIHFICCHFFHLLLCWVIVAAIRLNRYTKNTAPYYHFAWLCASFHHFIVVSKFDFSS